jgi:hypothetical protein
VTGARYDVRGKRRKSLRPPLVLGDHALGRWGQRPEESRPGTTQPLGLAFPPTGKRRDGSDPKGRRGAPTYFGRGRWGVRCREGSDGGRS